VDPELRGRYLEAIGIDVWVPRAATESPGEALGGRAGAPGAPASRPGAPPEGRAKSADAPACGSRAVIEARAEREGAAGGADWEALRQEVLTCTRCALHQSRTQGVLGVGSHRARWMVIGEAPGAEEDRRGEPFVGRAGQLLDAMLRSIELSRGTNVYIANILKSRPPGNRDPRPEEVAACLPYLLRQIELLRPGLLLAVGRVAAQNLLGTDAPLGRLRGQVHRFGELNTPLVVTYHPAYLLRSPADKRKAWEDLKFARNVFREMTEGSNADGSRP
jgi:uracil-DNA glycosylase family 4